MSWDKYLRLPVRTRWVMHIELCELVNRKPGQAQGDDDDDGDTAAPNHKRFMR